MLSSFHTTPQGDLTLELHGAFNADACTSMNQRFENICHQYAGHNVVVDMNDVDALDASGIGALVFMFKRLRASGGALYLCGVKGAPRKLLEMLHVHRAIPMYEDKTAMVGETGIVGVAA
ncbi:STAS domain-containing protein [Echinimonas agarilytica]|uniref:STAS domain-containing protein n=1 Tax=Echinimonas agarilytica TaxID=1215918 RepID=A0AA41W6T4_9GAMM|nr:STAS domain-containing protein [Echinimonas agarilytica]MCM2679543.1 STAS domain-containing protein [Echinimonas agarilytica]